MNSRIVGTGHPRHRRFAMPGQHRGLHGKGRVSTLLDTVGESFELNVAAAQEAGMLIGTAKPIILTQGSL